jgi:hypothetical protein
MSQAATEEPPSARPQVEGEEPKEKSPTPPPAPSDEPQHEYPTGLEFATIFVSLLLAVFCVALDNTVRPRQRPMSPRADLTMPPRSSLQQSPGSRMPSRPSMMSDGTGQRILSLSSVPTPVWEVLYLLQCQMGFPDGSVSLRAGIFGVWGRTHLECSDHRAGYRWPRIRRHIHGSFGYDCIHGSSPPQASLSWFHWWDVRDSVGCRSARKCL